ncbi:MAG TPA: hypothetical protein VFZ18_12100, partial [Longimicrobiaceae bacterium]
AAAAPAPVDALAGLPKDRDSTISYLTTSYKGVGQKTAEALVDAFGKGVFQAMQAEPDRVREVLGRRAGTLLEQWAEDYRQRAAAAAPAKGGGTGGARGGRGGRGGGGRKKKDAAG